MSTNKEKYTSAAQKLVEKGQLDKAIVEYLKAVKEDDKDFRLWLKIGDLYAKLQKRPEACAAYAKLAQHYSEQGFYLKAVAVYKQILKMDNKRLEVNQRLGELYKQLGLVSDAMTQFEALAVAYSKEGNTRQVIAVLQEIVDLDPEAVANRIKLAELFSKEQKPNEAVKEFARAAQQLKDAGRLDDYLRVAERLLFHAPDNLPVCRELARVYTEKGDPRRALPKLQVCYKAEPRNIETLSLLASAFSGLEQSQKAVSVWKEVARIQKENGDGDGRMATLQRVLELVPDDAEALSEINGAKNRSAKHRALDAVESPQAPSISVGLRNAINEAPAEEGEYDVPLVVGEAEDDPGELPIAAEVGVEGEEGNNVTRLLNETDVYIKYKLYQKAIEHVQQVFTLDEYNVEAHEKLKALYLTVGDVGEAARVLWRLADFAEAHKRRRYLHEILELNPNDRRASELLGASAGQVPVAPAAPAVDDDDGIMDLPSGEFDVVESSLVNAPVDVTQEGDPSKPEEAFTHGEVTNEGEIDVPPAPEVGGLEDELDEADFFVQQNLYDEARGMLKAMLGRYPNHPLVLAKLRDLDVLGADAGQVGELVGEEEIAEDSVEAEALAAELPDELPGSADLEASAAERPVLELKREIVERGVSAEDFEQHYDLGIAYKEMGLIDDAIGEFKAVMKDPAREAQCLLMIGLCYNEKAQFTESISNFKKALYVEGISDHETLSLYYELGHAYERLQDPREALYYYEKVQKRDNRFRNVERKIQALGGVGEPTNNRLGDEEEVDAEVEEVFETVDEASSK